MKNKIITIIPARGDSRGIPRRNIKLLCGKPLICYTIREALKSKYISRTIVSTEDEEVAKNSSESKYSLSRPFMALVNDGELK